MAVWPSRSIASRYRRSAGSPSLSSARDRASTPSPQSVPPAWVHLDNWSNSVRRSPALAVEGDGRESREAAGLGTSRSVGAKRAGLPGGSPRPHRGAGGSLASLSGAEQGGGVVVEDGAGGGRVDLGVVDVVDRADEGVRVFVGEVGSEQEPVRAE